LQNFFIVSTAISFGLVLKGASLYPGGDFHDIQPHIPSCFDSIFSNLDVSFDSATTVLRAL